MTVQSICGTSDNRISIIVIFKGENEKVYIYPSRIGNNALCELRLPWYGFI